MKSIAMLVDNEFVMDKRVYREAKTLSDNDFNLILYAVKRNDLPENEMIDGIKLKRIFNKEIFDAKNKKYHLQAAVSIAQTKPDIIHCHDWTMLHIGKLVKDILPDVILIYDSHELFSSYPIHYSSNKISILIKTWLVRKYEIWLERNDAKHIDYLITVSQSIANYLEKIFRLKNKPMLVRNFAEMEFITERK
ncbi:MAG: glycosyltransferase family 4 protein, partial [Ignavibacteria bacterium]|nr:glycosyltransferase family 4 protein [Ignavibacteria bacterium]